jgi:hypothetical protein
MSLTYVIQQLNIYGGSAFLFLGIVGNGMNIFIFSIVRNYRRTPCTFYFLIGAIHNIIYIIINLSNRILASASNINLSRDSILWCKLQAYTIAYFGLTSFTCSCLATIDQFFVTSRNVNLRRFSNIQLAYRLVIITMIIWCLHGIPAAVYFYVSPVTNQCSPYNPTYATYSGIYILIFLCGIPVFIMILFGSLTYRNMHLTRFLTEQRADRQLVRMILIQVFLVIISMIPYGCINVYSLITAHMTKSIDRLQKETLALTVFALISYFYYSV